MSDTLRATFGYESSEIQELQRAQDLYEIRLEHSLDKARTYAFSSEYAAARKLREGAGEIDIVVVEGT